jgi:hypothetical protein
VTIRRLLDEPQYDGSDQNERGNFHDVILLVRRKSASRITPQLACCGAANR